MRIRDRVRVKVGILANKNFLGSLTLEPRKAVLHAVIIGLGQLTLGRLYDLPGMFFLRKPKCFSLECFYLDSFYL
jgi:hypothetical protein